jgi:hypothetical protein
LNRKISDYGVKSTFKVENMISSGAYQLKVVTSEKRKEIDRERQKGLSMLI